MYTRFTMRFVLTPARTVQTRTRRFELRLTHRITIVQENDGSYFESFTALSWKNENRRMSAVRAVETRAEVLPENDNDRLLEDDIERSEQKEHLYLDVLYAIANTVGAPAPGGQFAHYKEEMYLQAQRVFNVSADRHYRLLHAATEEKPKIIVLTVVVQEADGLEAKDANGK
ncbi:AAEL002710-PA [Aedes aegypti]|uniref:AAEL002710-PA n=1 Tax=Aedes aegypti TaxID=7159 RepID=Q17HF4_AEDAE|nr:AAEL002710-PA [Aedes aegypti]